MDGVNKVLIIANPKSGSFREHLFYKVTDKVKEKFGNIEIKYTKYAGHAEVIVSETDADLIIAAGGDGLLNEIVNGLYDHRCLLLPLPFGTANVFCRELGLSNNPLHALRSVDLYSDKKLILGKMGGRYFLQMLGFGFDAATVRNINLDLKKRTGKFAYVAAALSMLKKADFKKLTFYCNSKAYTAYHIIVSLGKCYAGGFSLFKDFHYGYFGVSFVESSSRFSVLKSFSPVFMGSIFSGKQLFTDKLKVSGTEYCQMDGELFFPDSESNIITLHKTDIRIPL
ncbi:diacylglycerol kinase catalytic region [Flexistipes sinusarabici DSM 4947]|uniref:Diacylglycerol kinase catalytic region n=1 Tax=Flexistipes sinusarabici (strain ATCC 49648 / DSM 4947 / MAS 10) TaxID=717231 RepID=F8E8R5_FLESM|nr:diacylglycerol kinase family protein [Flexistipes sinusarabici]AEI15188.1 diacylglycerol kinase catalytic region [Flexistipes sinusarabici DSM 4947]